jgi:hypothetical protein
MGQTQELVVQSSDVPVPSHAVHWLQRVAEDTQRLIDALPGYADEELLACRAEAEALGRASWIIVARIDHEIMARAQRVSNKKQGDLSQSGVYATAVRQGRAANLDPTTILKNATIYRNFGHILTDTENPESLRLTEVLRDKGYWLAATYAPTGEMVNYLKYFADQKEADPRFTVRAAHRYVQEQKAPPLTTPLPPLKDNATVDAAFQLVKQAFATLNDATDGRLRGMLRGYEDEIAYELQLPSSTVMAEIAKLIEAGYDEIDVIRDRASWPRDWIVRWFKTMQECDWARPFNKGRVEGARGATRQGWTLTPRFYAELKRVTDQAEPCEAITLLPVPNDGLARPLK